VTGVARVIARRSLATLVVGATLLTACDVPLAERAQFDDATYRLLWCISNIETVGDQATAMGRREELEAAVRQAPELARQRGMEDRVDEVLMSLDVFRDVCFAAYEVVRPPSLPPGAR
jgi:hypothetical protein